MGRQLSDKQLAFIQAMIAGRNAKEAALEAGYAGEEYAAQTGYRLLQTPSIAAAVRKAHRSRIDNTLVPKALNLLEHVIDDAQHAIGVRVKAAQLVLQAGEYLGALRRDEAAGAEKPMSEMSLMELAQSAKASKERIVQALKVVEDLRTEAGDRVIEHEPDLAAPGDDQANDQADDNEPDPWD
ncbi:protein of unknown function [Magnetospirillum sp. XM-1]|uniref:terminase small subunit n=1 Tax=Magnetospirillum sp. XM-1 TaxID=1663591 RepID=UPI00073DD929|nr:terminase small subunit [Magnetospirillum sp. XM-1]CUW38802.1 protein of unknown function [Magnetospirillum sp. XM-1]